MSLLPRFRLSIALTTLGTETGVLECMEMSSGLVVLFRCPL